MRPAPVGGNAPPALSFFDLAIKITIKENHGNAYLKISVLYREKHSRAFNIGAKEQPLTVTVKQTLKE